MPKVLRWLLIHWNQNVVGRSPKAPFQTWNELKEKCLVGWEGFSPETKQSKFTRLEKEFNDETWLMGQTFMKLIGVLTPLGLIFAFGQDTLKDQPLVRTLFAISFSITTIWVIWGLSTRSKVFKRPSNDVGVSALMVDDGAGKVIEEEVAADIWWLYQWHWHRHHTRIAIDRLFYVACITTATTLLTMLFV